MLHFSWSMCRYAQPPVMGRGCVTHYVAYLEQINDMSVLFDVAIGYLPQLNCWVFSTHWSPWLSPSSFIMGSRWCKGVTTLCKSSLRHKMWRRHLCFRMSEDCPAYLQPSSKSYIQLNPVSNLLVQYHIPGTRTRFMACNWEKRMIWMHCHML